MCVRPAAAEGRGLLSGPFGSASPYAPLPGIEPRRSPDSMHPTRSNGKRRRDGLHGGSDTPLRQRTGLGHLIRT